jgi:thymidylate synthase
MHPEYQYLNLLEDILNNGTDKELFLTPEVQQQYREQGEELPYIRSSIGRQMRFDMSQGFPLLTTKKTFLRGIIHELIWFLNGDSNIKYLVDNDVHIWDEWAWKAYHKHCLKNDPDNDMSQEEFIDKIKQESSDSEFVKKWGELLTIYGRMWRRWPAGDGREIDQVQWVINGLRKRPYRKSYVVSAWNPEYIYEMATPDKQTEIPPFCHTMYHLVVTEGDKLNLVLYQRSGDMFLGVPFNIASYSLLLLMIAQVAGLKPGYFIHNLGDAHIYSNHFNQVEEQIRREPKPFPAMKLNPDIKEIDGFNYNDFTLENYDHHPPLKAKIVNVGGF